MELERKNKYIVNVLSSWPGSPSSPLADLLRKVNMYKLKYLQYPEFVRAALFALLGLIAPTSLTVPLRLVLVVGGLLIVFNDVAYKEWWAAREQDQSRLLQRVQAMRGF